MANSNVIRAFLVSLGYSIDETSQKQFDEALGTATKRAAALGAAVAAAAVAVERAATNMARDLEKVYWQSRRTGQSADNINAFAYAVSQLGGSADAAKNSLAAVANFLRYNPSGKSFLQSRGVDPLKVMNGEMGELAERWRKLTAKGGAFVPQAQQEAAMLGFDEQTFRAMLDNTGEFEKESKAMYSRLGVDQKKATVAGREYITMWRSTALTLKVVRDRLAIDLLPALTQVSKRMREFISDPKHVKDFVKSFGDLLHTMKETVVVVGTQVIAAFRFLWGMLKSLDEITGGWSTKILGAVALLKYLGLLGVALSPIGAAILAIGGAIVVLTNDYQNWKDSGGTVGLVDWSEWDENLKEIKDGLTAVRGYFSDFFTWVDGATKESGMQDFGVNLKNFMLDPLHELVDILSIVANLATGDWKSAWKNLKDFGERGLTARLSNWATTKGGQALANSALNPASPQSLERRRRIAAGENPDQAVGGGNVAGFEGAYLGRLEQKYGLPKGLLDAVWSAESGRGKNLRSKAGALGPFQFMPATAGEYGLDDKSVMQFGPSADAAARKYASLARRYGGDFSKAAAAYNYGEGNLGRVGDDISRAPRETRDYVAKINSTMLGTGGAPGPAQVAMSQTNTFHITGSDARAIGDAVGSAVNRESQQLVANTRARVR